MARLLDCSLEVNVFELQSRYYIHFQTNTLGKGVNYLIPPALAYIVSLLFFDKDDFGIE